MFYFSQVLCETSNCAKGALPHLYQSSIVTAFFDEALCDALLVLFCLILVTRFLQATETVKLRPPM